MRQPFKYYSDRKGSRVVEVDGEGACHIFDNGHAHWLLRTRAGRVTTLNYIQLLILLDTCHLDVDQGGGDSRGRSLDVEGLDPDGAPFTGENHLNQDIFTKMWNKTKNILPGQEQPHLFNDTDVSLFMDEVDKDNTTEGTVSPFIYPGTKWCGRGDIAKSPDDLGIYEETDKCCREHDHCPENIPAKKSKYGLQNQGDYTRSHCDCDQKFLNCLETDGSVRSALISFKIANLYFNILKPECFDRRHPPLSCQKKRLSGKCIAYLYDFQSPSSYQFFPAQPYIVRPARKLFDNIFYANVDLTRPLPTSLPLPDSSLLSGAATAIKPNLSKLSDNLVG